MQGCRLQGCRQQVAHGKAAGSRLRTARLQAARMQARRLQVAGCTGRCMLQRCKQQGCRLQGANRGHTQRTGENVILVHSGTQKSMHLPRAGACSKQNLGYLRNTNGQKVTTCCKEHTDCLSGWGGSRRKTQPRAQCQNW